MRGAPAAAEAAAAAATAATEAAAGTAAPAGMNDPGRWLGGSPLPIAEAAAAPVSGATRGTVAGIGGVAATSGVVRQRRPPDHDAGWRGAWRLDYDARRSHP